MQNPNLFELITGRLAEGKIASPRLEARLLIAYALGIEADELNPFAVKLNDAEMQKLMQALQDRLNHKPICKIIGKKAFYKYEFQVDCNVLSPRLKRKSSYSRIKRLNAHSLNISSIV